MDGNTSVWTSPHIQAAEEFQTSGTAFVCLSFGVLPLIRIDLSVLIRVNRRKELETDFSMVA